MQTFHAARGETDGEDDDVPSAWLTVAPVAVGLQVCHVLLELSRPHPGVDNARNGKFLAKCPIYSYLTQYI